VLGSVQTFCIDPLKEVFGVEEMAAGSDGAGEGGGGVGGVILAIAFRSKIRKGQPPHVHTTCYDVHII
jgi:hypothetical protein